MGESGRGESPDRNPRAFVREFLSKSFSERSAESVLPLGFLARLATRQLGRLKILLGDVNCEFAGMRGVTVLPQINPLPSTQHQLVIGIGHAD